MTTTARHLNRREAAEWFQARGFRHVTVRHLSDLADTGRGPEYARIGKYVYYAETALQTWLDANLKPVTRGRAPATTGRAA